MQAAARPSRRESEARRRRQAGDAAACMTSLVKLHDIGSTMIRLGEGGAKEVGNGVRVARPREGGEGGQQVRAQLRTSPCDGRAKP